MKKAIIYCRVSSDEQAKGGSLKYQESALRNYCKSHDIEVVECRREDYSAKSFNRPQMNEICKKYLRKKKEVEVDYLLVLRWNRFTREASEGWEHIEKFRKYGIEVNAVEEHIDYSIAESKIMLSVYLSMAEVDNDKRSKATKDGIHQALADGKCAGLAPFGYVNKRKGKHQSWVEHDEVEAPFVVEAFQRVAYGVIAPTLVWRDLKSRGMKVSESTFFRMLRNRFYVGEVLVPAYGEECERYVKGKHKPLIDAKTFAIVQKRLDGEKVSNIETKKIPDDVFYMRNLLRCPSCGNPIYGSFSKGRTKKYPYYHCNYCSKYRIKADEANETMNKFLSSLKPNEAVMALYEAILVDIQKNTSKAIKDDIKHYKLRLNEINNRVKKVQDKWFEGVLDDDALKSMMAMLNDEKKQIELKLMEVEEVPTGKEVEEKLKFALAFIENMASCVSTVPIDVKINILGSIFSGKIVIDDFFPRTVNLSPLVSLIVGKSDGSESVKTKKPSNDIESFSRGG